MMFDLTREQLTTLQNALGLALFHNQGLPDEPKIRELLSIVIRSILDTYSEDKQQQAKEKVAEITSLSDQFENTY
mgnify:FL=1